MNRNWTDRILVTLFFVYISWKKACLQNFKVCSKEVIVISSEKKKAEHIKEYAWKSFFFCKLPGWYLPTLLWITYFTDDFQGFSLNEHISVAIFRSCTKCLKIISEIVVYDGWNPEICKWNNRSPRGVYEKGVLKTFTKFRGKHNKQSFLICQGCS